MDAYGDLMTEAPSVVNRTAALLRAVSADTGTGVSTTELARRTGIPRATAHRLLESLATEGLVERDARSGQWFLGPEIYVLGAASAPRYNITERAAADVAALARGTSESAFFSLRRGDHTVVLLAEDGDFPIRSHVLYEGARFPLGVVSQAWPSWHIYPTRRFTPTWRGQIYSRNGATAFVSMPCGNASL
ncbi:Putative IclR-family regulatory protein [Mycobacteroides abscessus]|nr:Putative IclR-family regulatory protein [Mycobacteroides abscessus]